MSERKFCNPYHTRHHHHHTPTRFATVLFRVGRLTAICSSGRGFLFWGGKKNYHWPTAVSRFLLLLLRGNLYAHWCTLIAVFVVRRLLYCSAVLASASNQRPGGGPIITQSVLPVATRC
jgi:hypothetical protein